MEEGEGKSKSKSKRLSELKLPQSHMEMKLLRVLKLDIRGNTYDGTALSKNLVIYHRGERRVHRVLRLFQSLRLGFFFGTFAFSVCSAVKFKDIAISLENSTVPRLCILNSLFQNTSCDVSNITSHWV